eukprot:gene3735-4144_t
MVAFADLYEMGDQLGSGSYATVFRAKGKNDGKFYAAKIIDKAKAGKKAVASAESERDILKVIRHPNVMWLKDYFDDGVNITFVLELVEGTPAPCHKAASPMICHRP